MCATDVFFRLHSVTACICRLLQLRPQQTMRWEAPKEAAAAQPKGQHITQTARVGYAADAKGPR